MTCFTLSNTEASLTKLTLQLNFISATHKKSKKEEDCREVTPKGPFNLFTGLVVPFQLNNTIFDTVLVNGDPYPDGVSPKGLNWLMNNYISSEKDLFIHTYPKVSNFV